MKYLNIQVTCNHNAFMQQRKKHPRLTFVVPATTIAAAQSLHGVHLYGMCQRPSNNWQGRTAHYSDVFRI